MTIMADFFITDAEADYLEFILEEDLELGSSKTDFVSLLLAAVSNRDTLKFEPPPRDAKIIPFPNRFELPAA
jgi:hypothetical protein